MAIVATHSRAVGSFVVVAVTIASSTTFAIIASGWVLATRGARDLSFSVPGNYLIDVAFNKRFFGITVVTDWPNLQRPRWLAGGWGPETRGRAHSESSWLGVYFGSDSLQFAETADGTVPLSPDAGPIASQLLFDGGSERWFSEPAQWSRYLNSRWIAAPYWMLAAFTGAMPAIWAVRRVVIRLRKARSRRAGRCRKCGYDLRATTDRCPECGTGKVGLQSHMARGGKLASADPEI